MLLQQCDFRDILLMTNSGDPSIKTRRGFTVEDHPQIVCTNRMVDLWKNEVVSVQSLRAFKYKVSHSSF